MNTIGERLQEERKRLGFNQTDFGLVGGVRKQAQIKYEKGERQPDAGYLAHVATVGADVQYIVTGLRQVAGPRDEREAQWLAWYRRIPAADRAHIEVVVAGFARAEDRERDTG